MNSRRFIASPSGQDKDCSAPSYQTGRGSRNPANIRFGQKQTFCSEIVMLPLPPEADVSAA
jgi:hypothetical protein